MFNNVIGNWPTHERFILTSCDEKYFNRYFPRFYKTFTKKWQLLALPETKVGELI